MMKLLGNSIVIAFFMNILLLPALANSLLTEGAKPGHWTQDYDAAIKLAQEKNLPIMVMYTGSDWCGWCKLMDKQVFSKPEFYQFAEKNIILVSLDYPRDKSLVPEKYQERNQRLLRERNIMGLPTYVILQADGRTELGRLGAGRDKTVESFVQEVKNLIQ
ncbi:MAG: thioredoxin family protein [Acidobacteria bacterium]|nr:thioredoxin family protein [Acidobacteriota bacterium]